MNNWQGFFDFGDAIVTSVLTGLIWLLNQRFSTKKQLYKEIDRLDKEISLHFTHIKTMEVKLDNLIELLKETRNLLTNKGVK